MNNVTNVELERAKLNSVQSFPNAPMRSGGVLTWGARFSQRVPLLPPHGTRERLWRLREYYRHDYNTIFRGGSSGLTKKLQSAAWKVTAAKHYGTYWDDLLRNADFGSWERFISKISVDFLRYDCGAFIEIIAPGNPMFAPIGSAVGLAVLDPLRCYLTGDPDYPVIYFNLYGQYHLMHHTRVVQFVDMPETEDYPYGYGDCALSRCIAPVSREILMGRYIEQYLDDNPPPGIAVFGNLGESQFQSAIEKMEQERSTDFRGTWGKTVRLYGLNPSEKPTVEYITYTRAPEGFDYEKYTNLNVKEIALGMGIDVQDLWELTGNAGLGTGAQSEILAQKARGKTMGRMLRGLERVLNQVLPEDAEFEFEYEDPAALAEQAALAERYASIASILSGTITQQQALQLLANEVPAFQSVLLDEDGQLITQTDVPAETVDISTRDDMVAEQNPDDTSLVLSSDQKDYSATRRAFEANFEELADLYQEGLIQRSSLNTALRGELRARGKQAYLDGLRAGGVEVDELDEEGNAAVSKWAVAQTPYVTDFTKNLESGMTSKQLTNHASMWASKSLNEIYYEGIANADRNGMYRWVEGDTKDKCVSCLGLNGQVHRMKDYRRLGLIPGSRKLVCSGYNCACKLEKARGKAVGRLRAVRYVRRDHAHVH